MKDFYLINYSVKGIKSLDQKLTLSFYKKTIQKNPDTRSYNIKGIYGINGAGKSALINSVEILKNILMRDNYLTNPLVQKKLNAIINKKLGQLDFEVDFLSSLADLTLFHYELTLSRDISGRYCITSERFAFKKATSREKLTDLAVCSQGEIVHLLSTENEAVATFLMERTKNLLSYASLSSLFVSKLLALGTDNPAISAQEADFLFVSLCSFFIFANKLHVYLDQSDDHTDYFINSLSSEEFSGSQRAVLEMIYSDLNVDGLQALDTGTIVTSKQSYHKFEQIVEKLYDFIHIFKYDLKHIEIETKEDKTLYLCNLIFVYDSYQIYAEFESTGIKKLIRLFMYLRAMVQGDIVFIDEFDSNLHDVYLCALLEYLMEYGDGQLCFTTHNVGPMDILKRHKKSIDFLSENHQIYPWSNNGNYSPSNLYRNGMIEGSPFNVDSIDFIGIFDADTKEDKWDSN